MSVQLANALVQINNESVGIIPNTLVFTEGFGEQTMRAVSVGGGQVETVYSQNIETSLSMVNFELPATIPNIDILRTWKQNGNQNVITVSGETPEGTLTRTFTDAALLNDYPVALGSETSIEVEFKSAPSI